VKWVKSDAVFQRIYCQLVVLLENVNLASCHVVIVITANNYYVVHEISFFLQTVSRLDPKFIALHCQEVGGKNYECSMKHVEYFVRYVILFPLFLYLSDEIYDDLLM